nr:glutamate synthase [Maliibacterium massiliense]
MTIDAQQMHFQVLNDTIKAADAARVCVTHCLGQRYIGCGMRAKYVRICGTPGNALGAYLDGATLEVLGNAQDATGDTMNGGAIIIHGSSGDATGYAMRGGRIFVKGDAGYRAGIHMKAYEDKVPVIVVGGTAGSFLGEYQAGGLIVVLNCARAASAVGAFCATGMHGGRMFLRMDAPPQGLPPQVTARRATAADLQAITPHVAEFARAFQLERSALLCGTFYVLAPDTQNPYKQLYTAN